jgi:hypothetical protein
MTVSRIDLSTEYFGGMNAPTVEQAGAHVRVDATGLNLEYPGTQQLVASGTWDGESHTLHVKGSGARTIALPDPDNGIPGTEVLIVDALGNSNAGNITIDPAASGTIASAGGAAASTLVLSTNYASARLQFIAAGTWVRV